MTRSTKLLVLLLLCKPLLVLAQQPGEFVITALEPSKAAAVKAEAAAAPTPYTEIIRVLDLLPKPEVAFIDFGCGSEARWCIAAAEKWHVQAIGIELDPVRAKLAKERVAAAGLTDLVTIVEGDATTLPVKADVGVAYLYPETLQKLKPQIEKLKAFASFMHQPPVLSTKNGNSWIYTAPAKVQVGAHAVWNGVTYTGPVCSDPNCVMCNSIRAQINASQPQRTRQGYWVKHCQNGKCWLEWISQ
jgi:Ribosomal protein L11 methyltransferase (PrmA)